MYFKAWKILTVPSNYTISLMTSMVNNMEHITFNFSVHSINTRNKLQLLRPLAQSLHNFKSITIFNKLPECAVHLIKDKHGTYKVLNCSIPLFSE